MNHGFRNANPVYTSWVVEPLTTQYDLLHDNLAEADDDSKYKQFATLKMLDFDWVFTKKNMQVLVEYLSTIENEQLLTTEQIRILIELLWSKFFFYIFTRAFIPFIIYMISMITYFQWSLSPEYVNGYDEFSVLVALTTLCSISVAGIGYFFVYEYKQASNYGVKVFVSDIWSFVDISSIILNITILVLQVMEQDAETIRQIASVAVFLLWVKMFYWMRLFGPTAAFLRMIIEIIRDSMQFIVMFFICIFMFSNALFMLNANRDPDDTLFDPDLAAPMNSIIYEYLIGLGEFGVDSYGVKDRSILWTYFVLSTFITQITFMNLLIAIMGDTFDRVSEIKEQSSLKEKVSMIRDHIWIVQKGKAFAGYKYIFVVT
mmetsp:Transcript_102001/g.140935  ORF Transcript_102001/g.140935 Transcript_102001/m.140935 type:complete len:374 (+) Transcript_102001:574-1695(+)|eukprot:CAMPEP_0176373776 /NCGR_PEP_ID=MMETSP0126-20121128/26293_1 /TAXON_ID=141414 ORGANISM="Strombidinopsis acuminatum, Strain SPMC142" /NCGR_SAMPLE_ID=MMETSP0126 /ASSEMBLY_ACC=CAM_ASM_000229 /LENGTH=373 /DNA_ID=CAMNT_0017734085 /DNA_START=863 /DNA_END=1984 /DNA_ORIENTATION=+